MRRAPRQSGNRPDEGQNGPHRPLRHTTLVFCLLFAFACTTSPARDPRDLIWHLGAEPDTLNPITATDAYASRVNAFLYDSLVERDNETLQIKPKLATGWTVSPDHLTTTFALRRGVKWHDGVELTADDVVFAFERIMDPQVRAAHLRAYYTIAGPGIAEPTPVAVEKVDRYTVRCTYPAPYFLSLEVCGTIPILPRHLFKEGEDFNSHPFGRQPIGMGPYRFVAWETGKRMVIEANRDYWGEAPRLNRMIFEFIADDTIAFYALKKGVLDFAGLRAIQWLRQTDEPRFTERYRKIQFYAPSYSFIGWNLRQARFSDARVRQALTLLTNREGIRNALSFGFGKVVSGPFYFQSPYYDPSFDPYPYDPVRAAGLLDAAGWIDRDGDGWRDREGQPFTFEFLIPAGRSQTERIAIIVKEDFRKAGIDVKIRQIEWASFLEQLHSRSFDAVSLGWVMGYEDDPYQVWHSSQAESGSNFVGFVNPKADRLIEEGRRTFDPEARAALFRRFHALIYDAQPYTFLFSNPALVALDRRFTNVTVYPLGLDQREWAVGE